jgi:hypothetical protein
MIQSIRRIMTFALMASAAPALAVPIPMEKKEDVADPANFIPRAKHLPLPGKIIAVLLTDAQPLLTREGRTGPPDQLCLGWNGGSYRWVYVGVEAPIVATNLSVPLPDGKAKRYSNIQLASPTTVKPLGIDALYTLVEVEVNDGLGSPATDTFVATKMKKLDGSKEYPLRTAVVVADLQKQYQAHQSDKRKDLDAAMDKAGRTALKNRESTGPREESTLIFVTWLPEAERLQVRFLSTMTDGAYQYAGGVKIELGAAPPPPPGPPQRGVIPIGPGNGLRYGTQFGIEYGLEFQVSKTGRVEAKKVLEPRSFQNEVPQPKFLKRR